jgi:hypothetical protein
MLEVTDRTRDPGARREAAVFLAGSAGVAGALVLAYFTLPLRSLTEAGPLLRLVGGLVAVALLLAWQVRQILRSAYPRARAAGGLLVSVPLFLLVCSTSYFLLGQADPESWSESLSRLDALYFSLTVFATVGFGDITAVSAAARVATSLQMVGGLVLVGVIARVVVGAMQEGVRRRERDRGRDQGPDRD